MNNFRTFNEGKNLEGLNEYYTNGFYISATMLVMELDSIGQNLGKYDSVSLYDTSDLSEYMKANAKGFGVADPIDRIEEELTYKNAGIYVLKEKGKIVSSVTVWDYDDETVSTENIFTIPKYRGKNYALRVFSHALSESYDRGMRRARLTVYSTDVPAIKMYMKFGFKITKVLQEFSHE